MTTVREIQSAVAGLSPEELQHFREWFEHFEAEAWDRQIEADVRAGKLDQLAEKAINRFRSGECTEL